MINKISSKGIEFSVKYFDVDTGSGGAGSVNLPVIPIGCLGVWRSINTFDGASSASTNVYTPTEGTYFIVRNFYVQNTDNKYYGYELRSKWSAGQPADTSGSYKYWTTIPSNKLLFNLNSTRTNTGTYGNFSVGYVMYFRVA